MPGMNLANEITGYASFDYTRYLPSFEPFRFFLQPHNLHVPKLGASFIDL